MRRNPIGRLMTIAVAVAAISSARCTADKCQVAMADVDAGGWSRCIEVIYENEDTASLRDMNVVLHVSNKFSAERLPLEIEVLTPDSLKTREEAILRFGPPSGATASGSADVEAHYRTRVKLSQAGVYTVRLTPRDTVAGVQAAGIRFQTVK